MKDIREAVVNQEYCTEKYYKYLESLDYDVVRWMTKEELETNMDKLCFFLEYASAKAEIEEK